MAGTIKQSKIESGLPRQARPVITYRPRSQKDPIGRAEINKYIENFTYVDVASGESDSMTMTLANTGLEWASKWLPKKGDTLYASIEADNFQTPGTRQTRSCGTFCCDDRGYDFPETATATISGVSCPENHSFRSTPRTKTWKNVTLYAMAAAMGKRYGMTVRYFGPVIKIANTEQSDADDCSFLNALCANYGQAMKIYNGLIVIYDIRTFELKPAVATIDYKDIIDGSYNSTLTGTYTGARIKYSVKQGDKTLEKNVTIGTWDRMLIVGDKADNYADATRKVWAKIRAENRKAETLKITLAAAGKPLWAATSITITNAEWMSGKWFIDKATHTIGAADGYTIALELHKVRW